MEETHSSSGQCVSFSFIDVGSGFTTYVVFLEIDNQFAKQMAGSVQQGKVNQTRPKKRSDVLPLPSKQIIILG